MFYLLYKQDLENVINTFSITFAPIFIKFPTYVHRFHTARGSQSHNHNNIYSTLILINFIINENG